MKSPLLRSQATSFTPQEEWFGSSLVSMLVLGIANRNRGATSGRSRAALPSLLPCRALAVQLPSLCTITPRESWFDQHPGGCVQFEVLTYYLFRFVR